MNGLIKTWVIWVVLLLPALTSAEGVDQQYKTLLNQGASELAAGQLMKAAVQFKAAAALKPSPAVLLKVVSIYGDLALRTDVPDAQCRRTQNTMRDFFSTCDGCRDTSNKACKVCRFADPDFGKRSIAERTMKLAERFEQESQAVAQGRSQNKAEATRAQRKSKGLSAKAHDLSRCLACLVVTSDPIGAQIRLNGRQAGTAPTELTVFSGTHSVSAELDGSPVDSRSITGTARGKLPVHFQFKGPAPKTIPLAGPIEAELSTPAPSDPQVSPWPLLTMGVGTVLSGLGTYLMVAEAQTQSDIIADSRAFTRSDWDDARSGHTMGTALTVGGSSVLLGGLIWWYLENHERKQSKGPSTRGGVQVSLTPNMLFVGGEL